MSYAKAGLQDVSENNGGYADIYNYDNQKMSSENYFTYNDEYLSDCFVPNSYWEPVGTITVPKVRRRVPSNSLTTRSAITTSRPEPLARAYLWNGPEHHELLLFQDEPQHQG
jgi:hypothetical protein